MGLCSTKCWGLLLSALGLALSGYALFVEIQAQNDENYQAMCDIDETISCSKVFNSRWGRGFGFIGQVFSVDDDHWAIQPNPVYGLFFYSLLLLMSLCQIRLLAKLQFYLALISNIFSLYLGYILYFEIKGLCVVCVATYAVNFLLAVVSWCKLRGLSNKCRDEEQKRASYSHYSLPTRSNPTDFKKNI